MTEAMPFLQKYDITFLRPLPILAGRFFLAAILRYRHCPALRAHNHYLQ